MTFEEKYGCSKKEFEEQALKLPLHCFNEAFEKSFVLATNKGADPLEVERFECLKNVSCKLKEE